MTRVVLLASALAVAVGLYLAKPSQADAGGYGGHRGHYRPYCHPPCHYWPPCRPCYRPFNPYGGGYEYGGYPPS